MLDNEKTDFHKIMLPKKLMQKIEYFAGQWNESVDLCIQRTLRSGLIARREIKMKTGDNYERGI